MHKEKVSSKPLFGLRCFATFITLLIGLMFGVAVLVADGNDLDDKLLIGGFIIGALAGLNVLFWWGDA